MRDKLTWFGGIVILVALVAVGGGIVYIWASEMVEIFGVLLGVLVMAAWIIGCRIADHVAPRRDGESWFWGMLKDGGE